MKEGANKGRPYVSCASRKCNFFQWMDEASGEGVQFAPTPVRGKGGGKGDVCFQCNQPGHWASNCPNMVCQQDRQQSGNQSFGRDTSNDVCYKCNQTGHWASNCPNEAAAGKGAARGYKGYGKNQMVPVGFEQLDASVNGGIRSAPY